MNHELFSDILANIHNEAIRNFTIECLKLADPILEKIPASVSGKYHPEEARKEGGLVYHIRRACHFANIYMKAYNYKGDELRGDVLYSALLLHDIGKKADYTGRHWEYTQHPMTAAKILDQKKDMLPPQLFQSIRNSVCMHMGPWSEKSVKKPIENYTFLELTTYLCDYMASRQDITLDLKK